MSRHVQCCASVVLIITCAEISLCVFSELYRCHTDFTYKVTQGAVKRHTFPWLGFIQYVHVTTKLIHQSIAPRVVLIHKQYVLTTANEVKNLPFNYKLGNVIFGEYERDEKECKLTTDQIVNGEECSDSYLVIPLIGITVHPEYSSFGISNSVAIVKLLRPLKSGYMMPVCLPTREERMKLKYSKTVFLVDYISLVPQDFDIERMAAKIYGLYLRDKCLKNMTERYAKHVLTHVLCTPGCGMRPASPIISHGVDGRFELIGLAAVTGLCFNDEMRTLISAASPLYIDIFHYVSWIINILNAQELPQAYPQTARDFSAEYMGSWLRKRKRYGQKPFAYWVGHTYTVGDHCFKIGGSNQQAVFFYYETFKVRAPHSNLTITLQVSAGIECQIVCARVNMQKRVNDITVDGVGNFNITLKLGHKYRTLPRELTFHLGLHGLNSSSAQRETWANQVHKNRTQWYK